MYRYIKSNETEESKIGKNIRLLVYCKDVKSQYPSDIMSSTEKYSDDQEDMDLMYLSFSDNELKKLPIREIQKVRNLSLIQRIGHLGKDMYDKLSGDQKIAFARYAKTHHWLNKEDIPEVLSKIKHCTELISLYQRDTNDDFKAKYNLTDDDLLGIVHSIRLSDFNESTSQLSYHHDYYGDQILVFNVDGIQLPNGIDLSPIIIYIKLDYTESKDSSIAYFSIHES